MPTTLISGSTGFIGRRLGAVLGEAGTACRLLQRTGSNRSNIVIAELGDKLNLAKACTGIDRVFHCAGYAHAFSSLSGDNAEQHWRINFEGTRNLLEVAGNAGVKRFVFLSSVKAMAAPADACVDEDSPGEPETVYGQAKLAAENAVLAVGKQYGMHVVNLRLAMVYGAGGRGNLERMARLVQRGLFPPLPETGNHRSLVHVDDVVSAMRKVADDDRANGGTYIIASPHAPSGRELFDALRRALGMPDCSWSVPKSLLQLGAHGGDFLEKLTKRRMPVDSEVLDRLLSSAWYSPARIERELGWQAKISLDDGLLEMLGK